MEEHIDLVTGSDVVEVLEVGAHDDTVLALVGRKPRGHSVVSRIVTVELRLDTERDGTWIAVHARQGLLGHVDAVDRPDLVHLLATVAERGDGAPRVTCTARVSAEWYNARNLRERLRDRFYGGAVLLMLESDVHDYEQLVA